MNAKLSMIAIAVLAIVLSAFLVAAEDDQYNPNDPTVNERANACYEGGSMEGRCETDLDWQAGWYLIRFEFGIYTREQVPAWVVWMLPPEIVPETLVVEADGVNPNCYTIYDFPGYEQSAIFVDGVLANGSTVYNGTTCSGTVYGNAWTDFVLAGDKPAAIAACQAVDYDTASEQMSGIWYCSNI